LPSARGTGYVGGIPDEDRIWKEVAAGNIKSSGFDLNGGWVPWYMLHKVWDGLINAYLLCDNELAKTVVVKMSDWAYGTFKNLSEEKFQTFYGSDLSNIIHINMVRSSNLHVFMIFILIETMQ
tara:strand:- start:26034 stop:26402 length:369 start_codon:yes stop_codon:yes gene_type:complete